MNPAEQVRVFTIGHSSHPYATLAALLARFNIQAVADVRSMPKSKYAPQFDRHALRVSLAAAGIEYVYLGRELGGRPPGNEFYDLQGRVLYDRLAQSPLFCEGIERLENGARKMRVAMMCAEEDPAHCHRYLLLSRVLTQRGAIVEHIRADGRLQSEADLGSRSNAQLALFHANLEFSNG